MKNKKRLVSIVAITVSVLLILILVLIVDYQSGVSGSSSASNKMSVDCSPNRSFHEEVDATTGATLLWNQQRNFENIQVTNEEKTVIIYPFMNSVFPADFSPASFIWKSAGEGDQKWKIQFSVADFSFKTTTSETQFKPDVELWEELKQKSKNQDIQFVIKNKNLERSVTFRFSKDSVNAPIFYRGTPLPFSYANTYRDRLQWYIGDVSKDKKHIMLENMPVCANCHSFSKDGTSFAMDVDYGNDKGNYAIAPLEKVTKLGLENIVSWTDYKREDNVPTFGLLAKISPDGKYAISTVKDKSIFVPVDKSFWYSQLFFPVKGMLVYYDIQKKHFCEMQGASDQKYVQSSPAWAPDMSEITFSRAVYNKDTSLEAQTNVVLDMRFADDYINRRKDFKFDLYRVPWNDGNGGEPVAIEGASDNEMSNYFARYSPDGKWIVFCKAKNFMLLQSDSKLYIMPAKGGEPRLMNCNTNEMNSWHSFSPNSKWLIFLTKYFGPYTQLFLTHIDENGNDTPPIWLEQLTVDLKAANIPEFVNVDYDDWHMIKDEYTGTENYANTVAEYNMRTKDLSTIINDADAQIAENPDDYHGYYLKAVMLSESGDQAQAKRYAGECIKMIEKLETKGVKEYGDMGLAYFIAGDIPKAIEKSRKALEMDPEYLFAWMTLGDLYYQQRDYENTNKVYTEIIKLNNSEDYRLKRAELKIRAKSLYNEAIEDLEYILATEDCHVVALQMLVSCYSALKDFDKVDELHEKLIGCEPYVGYFSRGRYNFQMEKYQESVIDFTEGLKYFKNDKRALFFRAMAYIELKKFREAREDLQKVKEMSAILPENQRSVDAAQLDAMIAKCEEHM